MHNKPLISICIPTYNSALFLSQTLDSIAAQTYKNIEVIISDNASSDDTCLIAQTYCDIHGWELFKNETNIGAGNNFNKLIDLANGKYVAIYHADDIYDPTIVEKSLHAFQQSENIGLVGTMGSAMDKDSNLLFNFQFSEELSPTKQELDYSDIFNGILSSKNNKIFFITPSIMVQKECYRRLGNFEIHGKYKSAGDYEMWLRIANHYKIFIIDEKLIRYRIHAAQGSEMEIRQNIEIPDIIVVMEDYLHYVKNSNIKIKFILWKERFMILTALKQNSVGLYSKSSETLSSVHAQQFLVIKYTLRIINLLRIRLSLEFLRKLYRAVSK